MAIRATMRVLRSRLVGSKDTLAAIKEIHIISLLSAGGMLLHILFRCIVLSATF
jgi:hypothetical protein